MTDRWVTRVVGDFLVRVERADVHAQWQIFDGVGGGGEYGPLLFARRGASTGEDTVEDPEDAEIMISGCISWDGAAEWHVSQRGGAYVCGRKNAAGFAAAFQAVWDVAAEALAGWDEHEAQ